MPPGHPRSIRKIAQSKPSCGWVEIEDWPVCGRYIIREQEAAERYWRVHGVPSGRELQCGADGDCADHSPRPARGPEQPYEAVLARWGLVPYWARRRAAEVRHVQCTRRSASSRPPAFRGPWSRGQRCILPGGGVLRMAEARAPAKQPFFIKLADREMFGFAGLWERSKSDGRGADGVLHHHHAARESPLERNS